jgi:hypothetical protein
MADEDYESDIEIVSDSESETKEVKRNIPKKIIQKTSDYSIISGTPVFYL